MKFNFAIEFHFQRACELLERSNLAKYLSPPQFSLLPLVFQFSLAHKKAKQIEHFSV